MNGKKVYCVDTKAENTEKEENGIIDSSFTMERGTI